MTKSNGIASLKQAAKLLNRHAPDGESLAYINPEEARLLKASGGSGIMTLAGVPSYAWYDFLKPVGQAIKKYAPKVLEFGQKYIPNIFGSSVQAAENDQRSTGTEYDDSYWQTPGINPVYQDAIMRGDTGVKADSGENPFLKNLGSSIFKSGKEFLKKRYGGVEGLKQGGKDVMATLAFLKGKKDREGLNADEMKVFDELTQRTEAAREEFQANIAGGGVTNMPETIEDVASYTDVTLPTMKTTAVAEGGRIGAFNGGIQGLMPQQGFMPQPGLDPRMGYALGEVVEDQTSIFNTPSGEVVTDQMQETEGQEAKLVGPALIQYRNLQKKVKGYVDGIGWVYGEPTEKEKRMYERLKNMMEEEEIYSMPILDAAQGGRIGYNLGGIDRPFQGIGALNQMGYGGRIGAQGGGIMPLLNMGGMEKDYRQDGGFVPIGRKEKADDVPARLSKNEFVFTADAVKAAGGGDIDQGAQRMYNVMKNLEAGGEISEQSQGQGQG